MDTEKIIDALLEALDKPISAFAKRLEALEARIDGLTDKTSEAEQNQ